MTLIGRLINCPFGASRIALDREHDLRKGDTLAASYIRADDPPLRNGRLVVAATWRDGTVDLTGPAHDSIVALVAHPKHGDWIYRVEKATP